MNEDDSTKQQLDELRPGPEELARFWDEWALKDGNSPGYNLQKAKTYGEQANAFRLRAEKAEAERDEALANFATEMDHRKYAVESTRRAERERDVALNGFSKLVDASDAALVTISAERQRVTVALAAAQARERELRDILSAEVARRFRVENHDAQLETWRAWLRQAHTALSAPQDDSALRALLIRVRAYGRPAADAKAIVDAVLKGE